MDNNIIDKIFIKLFDVIPRKYNTKVEKIMQHIRI